MRRLLFAKLGEGVWLSHLDTMRLMQRAFSRAGYPLKYSQGFSPKPYLSAALPLSVGTESICEILDYELTDGGSVTPERLNAVMPEGIRILKAYDSERKIKDLAFLQTNITLEYDGGVPKEDEVAALFKMNSLIVTKFSKKGEVETEIRPMIKTCVVSRKSENELALQCVLSAQNPSLNPAMITAALEKYLPDLKPDFARYKRMETLDENLEVFR